MDLESLLSRKHTTTKVYSGRLNTEKGAIPKEHVFSKEKPKPVPNRLPERPLGEVVNDIKTRHSESAKEPSRTVQLIEIPSQVKGTRKGKATKSPKLNSKEIKASQKIKKASTLLCKRIKLSKYMKMRAR